MPAPGFWGGFTEGTMPPLLAALKGNQPVLPGMAEGAMPPEQSPFPGQSTLEKAKGFLGRRGRKRGRGLTPRTQNFLQGQRSILPGSNMQAPQIGQAQPPMAPTFGKLGSQMGSFGVQAMPSPPVQNPMAPPQRPMVPQFEQAQRPGGAFGGNWQGGAF